MLTKANGKHKPSSVYINQIHLDWGHLITVDLLDTASSFPARAGDWVKATVPEDDFWADESWGDEEDVNCDMNSNFICVKPQSERYHYISRWLPFPGTGRGTQTPKAQYGGVTQFLDLSSLYGNPFAPQKLFFSFENTPWLETTPDGRILNWGKFPDIQNGWDLARLNQPIMHESDWKANGDYRYNKTPGLRVLIETFRKEHNRLIDVFREEHPSWDNKTLFHEARRWNIAFFQSITLREYLAAATGEPLKPYEGYKPDVNPGVDHFFANVALRYGHSAVPALIPLLDDDLKYCPFGALEARTIWLPSLWYTPDKTNPWVDEDGNDRDDMKSVLDYESILRGLANSAANTVDLAFIDDLRNFLSQAGGPRHGEDLILIDVFRSRDAGLPNYNKARQHLGLEPVTTWSDITDDLAVQGMLKKVYGTIDRVDAFVGTFAESHSSVEVGPTASKSMHEQYTRSRDGDRFYFELEGEPHSFTREEIAIIHQTKVRDLILRNWDISPSAIPENAFFLSDRQLVKATVDDSDLFPDPPAHPKGLPWVTRKLSASYVMHWAIDRLVEPHDITFYIQVKTQGWAGLGFKPESYGTMKGADIVLCRETEDIVECRDSHAFDVGVPTLDTVGLNGVVGENSIRDVSVSRTDGVLSATWTRAVENDDPLDSDITDDTRIIFAFNPTTNELKYHGPTRNPDTTINFQADYLGPPMQVPISRGITIFLYIIAALGCVSSFLYTFLVLFKKDFFRFQTPEFCVLINFGALLGYASVFLILPDDQTDGTCWASMWLFGMSFWIVFLGFFIKVARVFYIIKRTEKTMEVAVLPFWKLFIPIVVFMLGEAVFNICWDVLVPPNLEREDDFEANTYMLYCGGDRGFWAGSVAFRAVFLGLGALLAVLTKNMPQEFNWSKEISASIYTSAVILFIGIPLGFALSEQASMVIMLRGITITLALFAVTTIVHFDSLKRIAFGKGPRQQTKTSHSMATKSKIRSNSSTN
eukprot:TRINITY_DN579_c0_g1_i1.p1 TRINITY_DN579_c0_g1~~TRINITY_DN579_c0_g1_i1.p1  ORF type:complete len:987 (+),score=253.57 TRINITY_DN579_c0_g1_i1:68-3028(+)